MQYDKVSEDPKIRQNSPFLLLLKTTIFQLLHPLIYKLAALIFVIYQVLNRTLTIKLTATCGNTLFVVSLT